MRLISCHIDNFGKLHDYSVDFHEKEHIICEENGWGKSTFAAFLRAMFYGLEGKSRQGVERNEYKRYTPWQGGVFGGRIVFEVNGKKYELTRQFDTDFFELRDADINLISTDYSKNIGEELFKINRDSFVRTSFIGQNDCQTASTDDINAKIGNLSDNTNDLNNYEKADKELKDLLNAMHPVYKRGSIAQRKDAITELERKVIDGSRISESMLLYQEKMQEEQELFEQLKIQLKAAGIEQARISKLQSDIEKKKQWDGLVKTAQDLRETVEILRKRFPSEVPSLDEVEEKDSDCTSMVSSAAKVSTYAMTDMEKTELSSLANLFEQEIPSDAKLEEMIQTVQKWKVVQEVLIREQITPEEQTQYEELNRIFANDSEDASVLLEKWGIRSAKKSALPATQSSLAMMKANLEATRQEKKTLPILLLAGLLVAVIGVAVAFAVSMVPGMVLAVIGAALAVIGIVGAKKASKPAMPEINPEIENLQKAIAEDADFIRKTDEEVAAYLTAHGKTFEEYSVMSRLNQLSADYTRYQGLKGKVKRAQESNTRAEAEVLELTVKGFLQRYDIYPKEERFSEDLYELKGKTARYEMLKNKKEQYDLATAEYEKKRNAICSFLEQFGFQPSQDLQSQLRKIRDDIQEYLTQKKLFDEADRKMQIFRNETDEAILTMELTAEDVPTLDEIAAKIEALTEKREKSLDAIKGYCTNMEDLQEQLDEWEEMKICLEELKIVQASEEKKYKHIEMAKKYLGKAKEALTIKYVGPIQESFRKYYEIIARHAAEQFRFDANANVTVEELGKQREIATLSSGYKDLVGVCLRVAFVDAMYQEELPVLIMDDPFTNLDDQKMVAAKAFLKEVSKKYQVIYFTCSEARV